MLIQNITDQDLCASLAKVKERILAYWDRLFADPLVVEVNGEKRVFFVHRTNNLMERHFRQLAYGYRRIHGNRSVRRNLENVPEQLPMVENLRNPDYIKLVFDHESNLAKRFSEIDVELIRTMSAEQRSKKRTICSYKMKCILRQPDFKRQIPARYSRRPGIPKKRPL